MTPYVPLHLAMMSDDRGGDGANPLPATSHLNCSGPNTTIPTLVIVQVGTAGSLKLHNGSCTSTNVVVDTAGYFLS